MEERAAALDEFGKVLENTPFWAVSHAFDEWTRTRTRRPSPAEISILAQGALQRIQDELNRRSYKPKKEVVMPPRLSPEEADKICQEAGFTIKRLVATRKNRMARNLEETQESRPKPQHWSETAPLDDPRWRVLKAARSENKLMKEVPQDVQEP